MSVMLHEGLVLTPRNLDQGARRSVPSICLRTGRPARSAELIGFRVCIIGITGGPANQRQPNNSIAPLKFPDGQIYEVSARAAFVPCAEPRVDAIGFARPP